LYKRGTIWWVKYYRNGRPIRESTGTEKETEAKRFLKLREGDVATGRLIIPRVERIRFEELAQDYLNDYRANGRRSLGRAQQNVDHLARFFGGCRVANITTADIRAANGTINRELTALRRMFNLALQAEKIRHAPHVPHLQENNVRQGFFEEAAFHSVLRHLPHEVKPVATFAYITGWRILSEILPITWAQMDFKGGPRTARAGPFRCSLSFGRCWRLREFTQT
jgi:integrase